MAPSVQRTYSTKRNRTAYSTSSPISTLSSSPAVPPRGLKRPLEQSSSYSSLDNMPSSPTPKRQKIEESILKPSKPIALSKPKQKNLTQLHFCVDKPIIRTCQSCGLTYTKGAVDDESLHRGHCARVQRGMQWGREEAREAAKAGVVEVGSGISLKNGKRGRIISCKLGVSGKIGSKLNTLLDTINRSLNAPPLSSSTIAACKAYIFLTPTTSPSAHEQIIGCVIAQRITSAMAIATASEVRSASSQCSDENTPPSTPPTATLVSVDASTSLYCHPQPLPTHMGISRVFVPSTNRRQGIAFHLLDAAAKTFIHGCTLDPRQGDVAFTQPTADGHALMRKWGGGGVRIYQE